MRPNPVKQKLMSGGIATGTFFFEFSTPGAIRTAAAAGAEFALIDMEHTGWSIETIKTLCTATHGTDMVPLVRVPAAEYHFMARVMDMGAMGIMVPMVESAEQARRMVEYAKYPPQGRRGSAFCIAHDDYHGGDPAQKMASANEHSMLIAQIETAAGLENVEAIAAVDGIDVLFVGQSDLTSSLGIPGQFDHPVFVAAIDRVIAACRKSGKTPGLMPTSLEFGQWVAGKGFRMLSWSGDLWIYKEALRNGLKALREFAGQDSSGH